MEKYIQKCCDSLGEVGGKEGEKERRVRKGRKCICTRLHVPMMLANVGIRLAWFINIKVSIRQKSIEHIQADIVW